MRNWLILFLTVFLVGCGFTPKRYQVGSYCAQLNYRSEPQYHIFGVKLREELLRAGVTFLEQEDTRKPYLVVTSKRDFSTDRLAASTEARVYKINLAVTVKVLNSNGKILLPEMQLATTRSIMLRPHELVSLTPQFDAAEESAASELVNRAMEKLFMFNPWNLTSAHEN